MKLLRDGPPLLMAAATALTLAALRLPAREPCGSPESVAVVEAAPAPAPARVEWSALAARRHEAVPAAGALPSDGSAVPSRTGSGDLLRAVAQASRLPLRRR